MAALPTSFAVGTADIRCFGDGWHERQRDGRCAVLYRASREAGRILLARDPAARELCVLLSAPVGLMPNAAFSGEIAVDGRTHSLQLDGDWWVVRRQPLPESKDETLAIELRATSLACPDDILRNGDRRRLGWYVAAAWQA